jgi:hypothetical protein
MNSRPEITIHGKPSQTQLKDWYENGIVVSFTEADGGIHNGKITSYQPFSDDALLWTKHSRFGVYLRNITTYSFNECIALINKEFLLAVRERNYAKCTELLSRGANINEKFGEYSQNSHDACSFCGPNDTPLTHAVKKEDEKLVELLLKNGAKTEVFNCGETPLMNAAFKHNVKIVKLLLKAGANPNTQNERYPVVHPKSDLTAMHFVFLGLRDWLLDTQKEPCTQTVDLLIKAGFAGNHNDIANSLKDRGYKKPICDLFTQIWQTSYNKVLDNSSTEGAMAGPWSKLPVKLSQYIGTFLNRKDGGRLAQTCKQVDKIVNDKVENKAETNAKSAGVVTPARFHYLLGNVVKERPLTYDETSEVARYMGYSKKLY